MALKKGDRNWEVLGAMIEKSREPEEQVLESPEENAPEEPVQPLYDESAEKRVSDLEYEVSGLKNELQRLRVDLLERAVEIKKEYDELKSQNEEGWQDVYRMHQPEIKGNGLKVTTAIRGDGGHVYEKGFGLQIRDVEGEEPRIRVTRRK